jgi:hypothetical protein
MQIDRVPHVIRRCRAEKWDTCILSHSRETQPRGWLELGSDSQPAQHILLVDGFAEVHTEFFFPPGAFFKGETKDLFGCFPDGLIGRFERVRLPEDDGRPSGDQRKNWQ